jgi:hypothetical protein
MAPRRGPPSQGWKTFLRNHADGIVAIDLFGVPTISFRLLYGLLIMSHGRRQILWFGVTAHPTAEWIANQLTQACGWEQTPRYLWRTPSAPCAAVVHGLLQRHAHSFVIEQGCPGPSRRRAGREYRLPPDPGWSPSSICPDLICDKDSRERRCMGGNVRTPKRNHMDRLAAEPQQGIRQRRLIWIRKKLPDNRFHC